MKSHDQGPRKAGERKRRRTWIAAAVVVLAACGAWLAAPARTAASKTATPQRISVRRVRVALGTVEKTIRLTGTTAPERYAALLVPQLRGARGHAPSGSLPSSSRASTSAISSSPTFSPSGAGRSSSSSSSSSASPSSGSSASSGTSSVTVGSNSASSASGGALATALNRFSTPTSGSSKSSSGSSRRTALSSSSDLGSTASNRGGGGGGGGRPDDFRAILQSVIAPGSRVKQGQVIAEFDRQYQLLRLDDYRAAMVDLENGLKTLRQTLDVEKRAHQEAIAAAKADLDKAQYDLKTIPVQSAIAAEKLKLAEQEAQAQYKELLAEVKLNEASQEAEWRRNVLERDETKIEFSRAEMNADKLVVRAPIDGITVMSTVFRGGETAQIQAGDELRTGMMYMRVVDPSSMIINATVNQSDIDLLRVGGRARVRFDAYPDLELPARLYSIGAMPSSGGFRTAYVKQVPVVLKLEQLDPRVIPDLSVSVDVVLDSEPNAVVAPRQAIFSSPAGKPFVFVAAGDGWEEREVELGVRSHIVAAIRSGLKPGDIIAAERPPQEKR